MMSTYEQKLQHEAQLWGSVDEQLAESTPPDWAYHRKLRHNWVMHTGDIDALLWHVGPGMKTLELGCASGWLTLAMARRGADATGMDVSERSLAVAQRYYDRIHEAVDGTVTYQQADLNQLDLSAETYDIIAVKGTLHHLLNLPHVIEQVYRALKPGGLFWISDQDGDESTGAVLFASALMFLLPTEVSYADKINGLRRFGADAPSRIKASMEAEGLSPFEGAGRDHDWMQLVRERFTIERRVKKTAVTGYIAHQLALPDFLAMPLLGVLRRLDGFLVWAGVLQTTGVILYARKPLNPRA